MHASITVHDETTLTPYLARPHDRHLREHLAQAQEFGRPTFVVVLGTSCTGKTRTLYEAVRAVLPDWPLAAPRTDSDLAHLLLEGVPAQTIVWLDELQDLLATTQDGITVAKAITELLHADEVGSIVFAATSWRTNYAAMQARPSAAEASRGAGAVPAMLSEATAIEVPDGFTLDDFTALRDLDRDPRLRTARDTAAQSTDPLDGIRITQILAGGPQLVHRLYPPNGVRPAHEFSPAAKAVLHAAGDLRRVGMGNPLPRWAIEGAAAAYLEKPDHRPPQLWLPAAFDEILLDARFDDSLTGTRTLDIHQRGVPALTPRWASSSAGEPPAESYDFHEYLYQDHLARHRHTPTRKLLWDTLTRREHHVAVAVELAASAGGRGLLSAAIALLREHAFGGDWKASIMYADFLLERRAAGDVAELWWVVQRAAGAYNWLPSMLRERGEHDLLRELFGAEEGLAQATGSPCSQDLPLLDARDGLAELRERTHAGSGGLLLLGHHRERASGRFVLELDCDANPIFAT